jgi:hypothetical protein
VLNYDIVVLIAAVRPGPLTGSSVYSVTMTLSALRSHPAQTVSEETAFEPQVESRLCGVKGVETLQLQGKKSML